MSKFLIKLVVLGGLCTQGFGVDQLFEEPSGKEAIGGDMNKSLEIHKLQDDVRVKLKENCELQLEILDKEKKVLEDKLLLLKSTQNQAQAKNYTILEYALNGACFVGIATGVIGWFYICKRFYKDMS